MGCEAAPHSGAASQKSIGAGNEVQMSGIAQNRFLEADLTEILHVPYQFLIAGFYHRQAQARSNPLLKASERKF